MTSVAVVFAIAGILFIFAGLTGAAVWYNGKVTAFLTTTNLRVAVLAIGLAFLIAGVFLELRRQEERPTLEDMNDLLQPINANIQKQKSNLTKLGVEQTSLDAALRDILAEVGAINSSIDESYTYHSSKRLHIGMLLAKWIPTLGCSSSEEHYQTAITANASNNDLCEQISALRYNVAIYVQNGIEETRLVDQFHHFGLNAYVPNQGYKSGITEDDLAIVFPEDTPRELICLVHDQFRIRLSQEKLVDRVIPYLVFTNGLNQVNGPLPESRYAISLGYSINNGAKTLKPLDKDAWRELCFAKRTHEEFVTYVERLRKELNN